MESLIYYTFKPPHVNTTPFIKLFPVLYCYLVIKVKEHGDIHF